MAYVAAIQKEYGLASALPVVSLPKSTWYYHQKQKVSLGATATVGDASANAFQLSRYKGVCGQRGQAYRHCPP